MPDDPAISVTLTAENLAATRGGRKVFAGVSFALAGGDAMAVRGPNGAGKSTLLRVIAGLVRPAAGRLAFTPASPAGNAQSVHYAGHLDALKAGLSVQENLDFWARLWGAGEGAVEAALDRVGLALLAALPTAILSAGQRRRAQMARLLVARRHVWLLDEPTVSLDADGEAVLGRLVASHLAEGGIAVIATHAELPVAPTHLLTLGAA